MIGLLKMVVPASARQKIRRAIGESARRDRAEVLKAIPRVNLEERHIRNCRVVETRQKMLELLPRDAVAAEIGVSRGTFTADIMKHNRPKKLHLIDVWESERYNETLKNEVSERYAAEIRSGSVEINLGYSLVAGAKLPANYFDWVYIDTDHSYETTRDELALFATRMKPGGIIAGHDYSMGNWRDSVKYGVIEAVHEFCVKQNWELLHITTELTTNPSFAIRKIGHGA